MNVFGVVRLVMAFARRFQVGCNRRVHVAVMVLLLASVWVEGGSIGRVCLSPVVLWALNVCAANPRPCSFCAGKLVGSCCCTLSLCTFLLQAEVESTPACVVSSLGSW